jgi:hypothetical protein
MRQLEKKLSSGSVERLGQAHPPSSKHFSEAGAIRSSPTSQASPHSLSLYLIPQSEGGDGSCKPFASPRRAPGERRLAFPIKVEP